VCVCVCVCGHARVCAGVCTCVCTPIPIDLEGGWAAGLVWMCVEARKSCLTRVNCCRMLQAHD
jgi:hypothetical protein